MQKAETLAGVAAIAIISFALFSIRSALTPSVNSPEPNSSDRSGAQKVEAEEHQRLEAERQRATETANASVTSPPTPQEQDASANGILHEKQEQKRLEAPKQPEQPRIQALDGEQIDYPTFFAKVHTGLPVGKRYRFYAILSHNLCIKSDRTYSSHLWCGARADFDNQAEYESLLRGTDDVSGTIVASMGADGTINIHSFH